MAIAHGASMVGAWLCVLALLISPCCLASLYVVASASLSVPIYLLSLSSRYLLYISTVSTLCITPYSYAAPTRAMQGVTSYKSLVLILIHLTPNLVL